MYDAKIWESTTAKRLYQTQLLFLNIQCLFTFYLYRLQLRFEIEHYLLGQRLEYTIKLSYKYIFDVRAVNEVKKIEYIYMCVCVYNHSALWL